MVKEKEATAKEMTAFLKAEAETSRTPDYTTMTYDQLMLEVGKAWEAKDMKLMGTRYRRSTK